MATGRQSGDARRGRGRPPREPALLPSGALYDAWRDFHAPALERLLYAFDEEQLAWDAYEQRCKEAVKARSRAPGLVVEDPPPPPSESSVFACLRMCAPISADRRAEAIRECGTRRRPMPGPTASMPEIVAWLVGEAMAGGIACDFETAYQTWFVIADLLLRDADIGAIIARVHPDRVSGRSPRLSADETKALDADLARQERKRVHAKQKAFGYSAA